MPTQRPRSAERGLFHNVDEGRLPLTVHRTVKTAATIRWPTQEDRECQHREHVRKNEVFFIRRDEKMPRQRPRWEVRGFSALMDRETEGDEYGVPTVY